VICSYFKGLAMKSKMRSCGTIFIILAVMLLAIPVTGVGCQEEEPPPTTVVAGIELSSTLVPDVDLDVYVYIKQENPTTVPGDVIGTEFDITVESLALWGIASDNFFTFGGGLTLASEAEATSLHREIPDESKIWTLLSEPVIYFVAGSGAAAENLKSAISSDNFRYYDNRDALHEVSLLPNGGTTRLAAVAIARPSQKLVEMIAEEVDPDTSNLLEVLIKTANLQVVAAGLYAPEQIDVAEIARDAELDTILSSDTGILASIKSGWPGVVFSPIAVKALESAGYDKVNLGDLTVFKGYLDIGGGRTVPIMLRVKDNRVFAAVAGQESYMETLITSINL
jgi:hypothetical protein